MNNSTTWTPKHPALQSLLTALAATAAPVYLVGGVVRDYLMGARESTNDVDVVVEHSAIAAARRVADRLGWAFYALDADRDVARLVFTATTPPLVCDIAAMRGGTIHHDLLARDFTINAMAIEWLAQGTRGKAGELVDLTKGRADLEARLLRRVSPSSLAEDPVRLLRAVRFANQLGFAIEEQTEQQMLRMSATVRLGSTERLRDELWKMMQSSTPAAAVELLARYGLLTVLLPEVEAMQGVEQSAPHVLDVYHHSLAAVTFAAEFRAWLRPTDHSVVEPGRSGRQAARAWHAALDPWRFSLQQHFLQPITADHLRLDWLVWHALLHDVGKPLTRTVEEESNGTQRTRFLGHEEVGAEIARERLEALRFGRQEIQLVGEVVATHMRPHHLHASFGAEPISRRACFRFFRGPSARNLDLLGGIDVVMLALADYQAMSMADPPPDWEGYLRHAVQLLAFALHTEGLDQVRHPLVDGHTLMRYFDLKPGPEIGDLLEHLQEAQAAGEIADADEALALAATWVMDKKS